MDELMFEVSEYFTPRRHRRQEAKPIERGQGAFDQRFPILRVLVITFVGLLVLLCFAHLFFFVVGLLKSFLEAGTASASPAEDYQTQVPKVLALTLLGISFILMFRQLQAARERQAFENMGLFGQPLRQTNGL